MGVKRKFPFNKLIIWLVLISFLLSALLPLFVKAVPPSTRKTTDAYKNMSQQEKQELLDNLKKQKTTLAAKLRETRLKEKYAADKLRMINSKLHSAQTELVQNKRNLEHNQVVWNKTKKHLDEIEGKKSVLEGEAGNRILAIYKQSRVRLLDGLINSPSATDYLDHIYYQKRVMEFDKQVIDALVDQSQNISKYKDLLAQEAVRIASINKKLSLAEQEIAKQRDAQRQVLTKLQQERQVYEESERQLERESVKLIYTIGELASEKFDNPEATGSFIYPLRGPITSPFGPRRHPIFGVRSMHSGIDIAAARGTPVKASESGVVIYSGWYGGYGKVVIVDHSKGFTTLYAHLESTAVSVGAKLKQGDVLGYEGTTGYSTGPHLHFEVRSRGKPQNPVSYLQG